MGLDTSHNCWHGPYSAFHRWRKELAAAIGINLEAMVGFGGNEPWPSPIDEPLIILLSHSDCDGAIAWQVCDAIADRLDAIPSKLSADAADAAEQFAEGLRKAAAYREDVEFH